MNFHTELSHVEQININGGTEPTKVTTKTTLAQDIAIAAAYLVAGVECGYKAVKAEISSWF